MSVAIKTTKNEKTYNHSHWKKEFIENKALTKMLIYAVCSIIFPPLFLYAIVKNGYKLIKSLFISAKVYKMNTNTKNLEKLADDFNLKHTKIAHEETKTKLINDYEQKQLENNSLVLEAIFNEKNGAFIAYEYDKNTQTIVKNKVVGKSNGEYVKKACKMKDYENQKIHNQYIAKIKKEEENQKQQTEMFGNIDIPKETKDFNLVNDCFDANSYHVQNNAHSLLLSSNNDKPENVENKGQGQVARVVN